MTEGRLPRIRKYTPAMSLERRAQMLERDAQIRWLRLECHWSLADIAAQFGISVKRVSQIAPSGFRINGGNDK